MFVGLDVHKDSIDVSVAAGGREGPVRHHGTMGGDQDAVATLLRRLRAPEVELHFVYEAGPCGLSIYRFLRAEGEACIVVSPSTLPQVPSDRIKTDRRDSQTLARLHRAGELRGIYIPSEADEAIRDLVRARGDAVTLGTQAKHRLKAFLLRHDVRYAGRAGWTHAYRRWIATCRMPTAAQQVALEEYVETIAESDARIARLTDQLREHAATWRWAALVAALQALRGVSFVTAVGVVAEIGDLRRFGHPRELMVFIGLVPSEYSSGPNVRRGHITKTGNPHVRHLLAETAWAYQGRPHVGEALRTRQRTLSPTVCQIAWKAQLRLTGRFRRLVARGKAKPLVATAIARELTAFIWAIAQEVSAPAA
jgi:transposase